LELGVSIIHKYVYISTETVLSKAGIISQTVYPYTFISSVSKKMEYNQYSFYYRKLKDEFLHNTAGIVYNNGIYTATPERAVADLLYFDPHYHFDIRQAINWENVKHIQKEVGYL
jgi:acyl-[acyl carrier protein]--UDP-N-acetylglucosamine O-acyltransferase